MNTFGGLLGQWRKSRRVSQLALAMQADVSARHVSFLETGRAQPSRDMVMLLCGILDIPITERNLLLQSAGFAPQYSRFDLSQPQMQPVVKAMEFLLTSHEPYPASVLDTNWNVLMSNRVHRRMLEWAAAQNPLFPDTRNILELIFDPNGLRPFIINWEEIASLFLQRLYRECILYQQRSTALLDRILQYPGIPEAWKKRGFTEDPRPVVNLLMQMGECRLSLFSVLSSFGTAIDLTTNELVIEQFFPGDEATARFFQSSQ